jgi:hypothetical protein
MNLGPCVNRRAAGWRHLSKCPLQRVGATTSTSLTPAPRRRSGAAQGASKGSREDINRLHVLALTGNENPSVREIGTSVRGRWVNAGTGVGLCGPLRVQRGHSAQAFDHGGPHAGPPSPIAEEGVAPNASFRLNRQSARRPSQRPVGREWALPRPLIRVVPRLGSARALRRVAKVQRRTPTRFHALHACALLPPTH